MFKGVLTRWVLRWDFKEGLEGGLKRRGGRGMIWKLACYLQDFSLGTCKSVLACCSYQAVAVDHEGKLSGDVVHDAVRGRWRSAVQLFPSSSSSATSSWAHPAFGLSETVTGETCLCPSLHALFLRSFPDLRQFDHPLLRSPWDEHKWKIYPLRTVGRMNHR